MDRFMEIFQLLPDPRADNSRHELVEVLFVAFVAMLCGSTSCVDMEGFGLAKEGLLRKFLTLKHGVPSHDTFSAVFRMIDPNAFQALFQVFVSEFAAAAKLGKLKGVVAGGGKARRRAYEVGQRHTSTGMGSRWGTHDPRSRDTRRWGDG